jgi:hypothetical protein
MYVSVKMIHVKTIPGIGQQGIGENGGGGESKCDIFDTL